MDLPKTFYNPMKQLQKETSDEDISGITPDNKTPLEDACRTFEHKLYSIKAFYAFVEQYHKDIESMSQLSDSESEQMSNICEEIPDIKSMRQLSESKQMSNICRAIKDEVDRGSFYMMSGDISGITPDNKSQLEAAKYTFGHKHQIPIMEWTIETPVIIDAETVEPTAGLTDTEIESMRMSCMRPLQFT